jgi:hypothetical protein
LLEVLTDQILHKSLVFEQLRKINGLFCPKFEHFALGFAIGFALGFALGLALGLEQTINKFNDENQFIFEHFE